MRLLFTAVAARPHLYPIVPLAWACQAAGHDVRVAGSPSLVDDIVRSGLPAIAVGGPPNHSAAFRAEIASTVYAQDPWPADWAVRQNLLNDAQRAHLVRLGRAMVLGAEAMVDDLVAFARSWRPDVVVHDAVSFAGVVAAAALDIPNVRHIFGTAALPRLELPDPGPDPLPEYARLFERFGVDVRTGATLVVDPTPPSMRLAAVQSGQPVEAPDHDVRYVPYNGSGMEPSWLREPTTRPRVCVTWGHTSARSLGREAADPYRDAITALSELDVEVVVVTTQEQLDLFGDLPPGARAAPSVPLHLVLASCDALVQQGGDGTTLTAAVLGVPQLIITRKPDSELPAGRLAANGAGLHLYHQQLLRTPRRRDVIRSALEALLEDPSYRVAAGRLREEIRSQPPPASVIPALAALVA
jgi:glycosyltransferase